MTPDAAAVLRAVSVPAHRGARRRPAVRAERSLCARVARPGSVCAGTPPGRWRQRSVRCTDSPALLASGSGAAKLAALAARAPLGQSPRVGNTKRAARADPEAALLGAAEIALVGCPRRRCPAGPPERRGCARRAQPDAAGRRSGCVSGVRIEDEGFPREHRNGIGKGAGRAPRARLVRSREVQQHRRRAQRASSIILAAIVRAELAQRAQRVSPRQPVLRASQGTPAKRGQAPGAPAAPGPRLCSRQRPESQNASCALEPLT